MVCTVVRGQPIYPVMDWFSKSSMILFFCNIPIGFVNFWLIKLVADFKMRRGGYKMVIACLNDPNHIRNNTDITAIAQQKDPFGLYNHYEDSAMNHRGSVQNG